MLMAAGSQQRWWYPAVSAVLRGHSKGPRFGGSVLDRFGRWVFTYQNRSVYLTRLHIHTRRVRSISYRRKAKALLVHAAEEEGAAGLVMQWQAAAAGVSRVTEQLPAGL
jgi:hypothetical protein